MSRKDETFIVTFLAILYAIIFSWRLHFLQDHTSIEWLFFKTTNSFNPPNPIPMGYSLIEWGLFSRPLNPWRLLYFLYGNVIGMNLELPIHLAIAFTGGWVLARVLGYGWLSAIICASIWPSSSWIYLHFEAGHLVFLQFAYMPWMFIAIIIGQWWLLGILVSITFFEGGCWPLFYIIPALGVFETSRVIKTKSIKPITYLILAGVFSFILSIPKFMYMPHISAGPDKSNGKEHIALIDYSNALFSSNQQQTRWTVWNDTGTMPWWEIGAYISPFFIPLIIVGITPGLALASLATLILAMGDSFGRWSPYTLEYKIPLISWTWMAPHHLIMLVFLLGLMASQGAERLNTNKIGAVVVVILIIEGLIDCWQVSTTGLGLIT